MLLLLLLLAGRAAAVLNLSNLPSLLNKQHFALDCRAGGGVSDSGAAAGGGAGKHCRHHQVGEANSASLFFIVQGTQDHIKHGFSYP